MIEYKICFKLLSNLTFIKPSVGNNVALKSNKECERIPFVISKSNKLGFLIKSTLANIPTNDDIVDTHSWNDNFLVLTKAQIED